MSRALRWAVVCAVASSAACRCSRSAADAGAVAPTVLLLDAGAAPRAPLVYDFVKPPRPFSSVSQTGRLVLRGLFQGDDVYTPALAVAWAPAGDAGWRLEHVELLSDEKVPEERRRVLAELNRKLEGREVEAAVGPHGELALRLPAAYDGAEERALGELRRLLALQLTAPLPLEPVGLGARWSRTVVLPLDAAPRAAVTFEYTLTDRTGTSIDLAVAARLSGEPQPAPLDPRVTVSQLEGQGRGRIVRLLDEVTPVVSELELEATMTLELPDAGSGYKLVVKTRDLMQAARLGPLDWEEPAP